MKMNTPAASKIQVADSLNLGTNVSDAEMPFSNLDTFAVPALKLLEDSTGMKKTFTKWLGPRSTFPRIKKSF